jgi:predicted AlkP superfamily pyrophosphatase or phosphodiesterase
MKKTLARAIAGACLCCALSLPLRSQSAAPIITVDHGPNAPAQRAKHYVILVSLDGFRYDYAAEHGAPNLQRMAAEGASTPDGMIPVFPSVTFPNHYSIVSGLYPGHHGIVANSFYDPARKQSYASNKLDAVTDGTWYGGVPLWALAEKQGMRSACFFWPTSDADIAGARPSYYLHFEATVPDEQRVDQVIAWLRLPAARRPHFITLYYSQVDSAGHDFGPDSPQTGDAAHQVDAMIGRLIAGLKTLRLPVDVIVVADHGMAAVEGDWIDLDRYTDLSQFVTLKDGSLLYAPNEEAAAHAYMQLRGASDKFVVYRRSALPAELHTDDNPRFGDPVVIPTGPYLIRAHAPENTDDTQPREKGAHGYDPYKMKAMHAIFYAVGPDIRPGSRLPAFENIDVYPLIANILGLSIGPIDGSLAPLRSILQVAPKKK